MTRFRTFQAKLKNPDHHFVASALHPMLREAQMYHHRLASRELLALYLSAAPINVLKDGPIVFTFSQQAQKSIIGIGDVSWPVFPGEEGLYNILFLHGSEDAYVLECDNVHSLGQRILSFKPLFNKYFEINTKFGCDAIRQLRLYALINDYQVPKEALHSVFGYKTWIFSGKAPPLSLEVAKSEIIKKEGIKIT